MYLYQLIIKQKVLKLKFNNIDQGFPNRADFSKFWNNNSKGAKGGAILKL